MGPMMGPPPGGGREKMYEQLKPKKPTNIKEVPNYVWKVVSGFTYRLFYIFKLVWEARPSLLFIMLFMSFFNGIIPVFGSLIAADLINALVNTTDPSSYSIVGQIATRFVGDLTESNGAWSLVIFLLVLQFSYTLLNSIVTSLYNMFVNISGEIVTNHIKVKIISKSKDVDLASFDMPSFYEKLENANREAGSRPVQIMSSTFSLVSTIISMVSYIVVLTAAGAWIALVVILISLPTTIINFTYRRKNFHYMRRRSKDRRQMEYYSNLMVNKDMVKEIRLFNLSDTFIGRYQETFKKYFAGIKKLIVNENVWHISISVFTSVVNCLLYLYIANRVFFSNDVAIGSYSLWTNALTSVSSSVSSLISLLSTIYEGGLFIENLILFMSEKKTIVSSLPEPRHVERHVGHTIEFSHVSFRYPGTEKMVIKDMSFKLDAGETCVLVGLNGAGKTTLIKLMTRLYDPTEGVILLDGHDIKEYDTDELYQMFGIIFQDFGKYAVTVSENIEFGDIEKERQATEVESAAKQSSADLFIENLPEKYDTPLMRYFEEDGIELSIGQWQKLSIARAFYSDSDFLILDEPTASLDAIAEQEIFNQFDSLSKDKTTIFVSHRLSSATVASKILVIEYGELIEEGNHSQLMNKKGRYYELFTTQAKRYLTEVDKSDTLDGKKSEDDSAAEPTGSNDSETPADGFEFGGEGEMRFPPRGGRPPRDGNFPHDGRPPHGGKPPHDGKKPPFGERPPFENEGDVTAKDESGGEETHFDL
ncbi:MAG: ATP-binding cassette domain-containing protein [Firmicutes bacterium]|nr:ATP-binding cassette domain-containing protein [Bacillota bacterium]